MTQCDILEYWNPQQHCCKNVVSRDTFIVALFDAVKVLEKELVLCKFNSADDSACCNEVSV